MNENPEILTIEQIENYPAARLLRFVGDLDSTNAEATSNRILALLNDNVKTLVADFAKLRYINSTGLGALLFVNKKVKWRMEMKTFWKSLKSSVPTNCSKSMLL